MASSTPWRRTAVVYQIYPRSFQDSNGDGVGDLNGIASRLDELVALGVDALWLSPIQTSPMADFGYDISNYRGIDPLFGTLDDFDSLVAQAHERGLKILLDIVVNHSSDQHPWFLESRSSTTNPKRDWYLWRSGRRRPNNWKGVFGGSAWEWDEATSSWYHHSFLKQQPDLNWRNPELRTAIFDDLEFWLLRGVDGFRFDVFNLWFKEETLRDNPVKWWGWKYFRPYDWQKHLHDGFHPDIHDTLKELRRLLDRYNAVSVGETFQPDGWSAADTASYLGQGDGIHLAFEFSGLDDPWSARATAKTMGMWMHHASEPNWPALVYSNHDVARARTRLSPGLSSSEADQRAKVMAALLLLWKGTPFLYYGEEIGTPQVKLRRSEIRDPLGLRYWPVHPGRDGARTPVAWTSSANGGFTEGKPWLPLHPDYRTRNVEAQRADPDSLWNWYAALLKLRKSTESFQSGTWTLVDVGHRDVLAFRRSTAAETRFVLANFSSRAVTVLLDHPARPLFGTRVRTDWVEGINQLEGYEVAVLA